MDSGQTTIDKFGIHSSTTSIFQFKIVYNVSGTHKAIIRNDKIPRGKSYVENEYFNTIHINPIRNEREGNEQNTAHEAFGIWSVKNDTRATEISRF